MKRHRFDPVHFLFGAAFCGFALVAMVADPLELLAATWVWPAALIVLGTGLLLAPLAQRSSTRAIPEPAGAAADQQDAPSWPDGAPRSTDANDAANPSGEEP